eukprot:619174-Prorocentrum_minimum.AAC.2
MYLYLGEWNPRLWGIAEVHNPVYLTASVLNLGGALITSFYGSSCASYGKGALNTPVITRLFRIQPRVVIKIGDWWTLLGSVSNTRPPSPRQCCARTPFARTVGLDTDTAELTVRTLSSHLVTLERIRLSLANYLRAPYVRVEPYLLLLPRLRTPAAAAAAALTLRPRDPTVDLPRRLLRRLLPGPPAAPQTPPSPLQTTPSTPPLPPHRLISTPRLSRYPLRHRHHPCYRYLKSPSKPPAVTPLPPPLPPAQPGRPALPLKEGPGFAEGEREYTRSGHQSLMGERISQALPPGGETRAGRRS